MQTSIFKVFFSKEKEEKWLNSMGEKGYSLVSINDSKYQFDINEENTYNYSIEYLSCSPRSEDAILYFKSREEDAIFPIVSSGNWVYFSKKDGNIVKNSDVYKNNSMFYFWRALYMLFFGFCGAVVCGYQAFAIGFLERIGHTGNGMISKTFEMSKSTNVLNKVLNVLKKIGNIFFKMINKYFEFWTNILGESDAVAVISVVAPLTALLLVLGALNLKRYISYRKLSKTATTMDCCMIETEGECDAE